MPGLESSVNELNSPLTVNAAFVFGRSAKYLRKFPDLFYRINVSANIAWATRSDAGAV